MTEPALLFLPWVRRGGALSLPPDLPSGHPPSHVSTTVGVSVNDRPGADVPVQLLGPGDAYFFDSRVPHRFRNVGDVECELISACTPPYL